MYFFIIIFFFFFFFLGGGHSFASETVTRSSISYGAEEHLIYHSYLICFFFLFVFFYPERGEGW